jgi:hypothetical protein
MDTYIVYLTYPAYLAYLKADYLFYAWHWYGSPKDPQVTRKAFHVPCARA